MCFKYCIIVGGFLVAVCPHGICYGLKSILRCESVRDHIDMILSLRHQPSIVISDLSNLLARHGNKRKPDMFSPHQGRLAEPSAFISQQISEGSFVKNLPFVTLGDFEVHHDVTDHQYSARESFHPISRTLAHYCLSDEFHKGNMRGEADKLRFMSLVPELNTLNSQVAEQLFSQFTKDTYFLDKMRPEVHMFVLRLLIHFHNTKNNKSMTEKMLKCAKRSKHEMSFGLDGRVIFKCDVKGKCLPQNM